MILLPGSINKAHSSDLPVEDHRGALGVQDSANLECNGGCVLATHP